MPTILRNVPAVIVGLVAGGDAACRATSPCSAA